MIIISVLSCTVALGGCGSSATTHLRYTNPQKGAEMVRRAVAREGFTASAAVCPRAPIEKGRILHCQFIVEAERGSADIRITSKLGLAQVTALHGLAAAKSERLAAEYQEKCEWEFPARGRAYHRCMYY